MLHFIDWSFRKDNAKLPLYLLLQQTKMSQPIAAEMALLEESGIVVYDALLKKDVFLLPKPLLFMCDNPRASEITCSATTKTGKKKLRTEYGVKEDSNNHFLELNLDLNQ